MVPAGEDTQEAQQLPQSNDNDQEEEEDNEEEKKKATRLKVKMMKTTLLWMTPKRKKRIAMPMRSRPLEMKPRSPLVD
jgi:ABC-type Zn2+ transport system substrate-binding protein/surface adhesin